MPVNSAIGEQMPRRSLSRRRLPTVRKIPTRRLGVAVAVMTLVLIGATLWLAFRASAVKDHLVSAASLTSQLKVAALSGDLRESRTLLSQVTAETQSATAKVNDPLWRLATALPLIGPNFQAVTEMAQVADSLAIGTGGPILDVIEIVTTGALVPKGGGIDLQILETAVPQLATAAATAEEASARLRKFDEAQVLPQISEPLSQAHRLLQDVVGPLKEASALADVLPAMLGANEPRNYLLLMQNNAELRATGGLAGALALVQVDAGKMELSTQTTASALGRFIPPIDVDPEQQRIYTEKLGRQVSGVNLTPDFPTAAHTVTTMWEARHGDTVDGVIALDPIVLSRLLIATGPIPVENASSGGRFLGLPTRLNADNATKVLLADSYKTLNYVEQDKFFADVAKRVFDVLASGKASDVQLMQALGQSSADGRLLIWSSHASEQKILSLAEVGGSVASGPNAGPGVFGVYFNDGTGSKMDYYVRHTVELISECTDTTGNETTVRISISNQAPVDAATSLPVGVTGGGAYGVPPGVVQTNIIVYGPPGARVNTVNIDGRKSSFAPHRHSGRPVGVVTVQIAPGKTRTIDFSFGAITYLGPARVVVTPTVQNISDVVLEPRENDCASGND